MATSDTLLGLLAIRLAGLVVAGLVVRTVVTDHPREATACVSTMTASDAPSTPAPKPDVDRTLRDMLLHD